MNMKQDFILKFVNENNNNWYIDLPNWTGRKSALQMVSGADELLDLISNNNNEVTLYVSFNDFDGANRIKLVNKCWFNGANYICDRYDNKTINHKLWLCDVTKFVFGRFPDVIYFAPIKPIKL